MNSARTPTPSLGVGVLALFIGVALLSSRLVVPLTRLVGWPARRIGGAAGTLAEGNAMRDPGRTASTAAALMIGIALVTFVGVLAQGLRVSNSAAIEEQIQADLVVTSQDGYSEFPAAVGDAAAEIEGTEVVSNVRQDVAEVDGAGGNLTGLDAELDQPRSTTFAGRTARTRCWRAWATTERSCRTTSPTTRTSPSGTRSPC